MRTTRYTAQHTLFITKNHITIAEAVEDSLKNLTTGFFWTPVKHSPFHILFFFVFSKND